MGALLGQITLLQRFSRGKAHGYLSQRAWDLLTDLTKLGRYNTESDALGTR